MVKHLTQLPGDGTVFGQTTADLISFYNLTPIVQPTHTDQAAITAGATATATTALVIQLRLALVNLGLIKGS